MSAADDIRLQQDASPAFVAGLDALARFLENHGEDFIYWRDGRVVVETFYDKQFRVLGGDTHRLISFFEDYSTMHDAARHYIAEHAGSAAGVQIRRARTRIAHAARRP